MTFDGHELLIRSTMAELTSNFAAGTPIEDTLASVTAAAMHLISGVYCADVLLIRDGEHQSVAATSEVAPKVDAAQRRTGEGPCLDAAGPAGMIRCDNLAEDARWPRFAAAAIAAGGAQCAVLPSV